MLTPTFGCIDLFNAETESLALSLERFELFLQVNGIPVGKIVHRRWNRGEGTGGTYPHKLLYGGNAPQR